MAYALVIGESLVDVIPGPSGRVAHPGGSSMNVAVGLSRLGHETRLATWFARDEYGQAIAEHLAASNVELIAGSDGAPRTSSASVRFDDAGSAQYDFDLTWQPPALPQGATPMVAHAGSLGALLRPGGEQVLDSVRDLRSRGVVVSFDPNIRLQAMGPMERVRALAEAYVAEANIVKASDEDLGSLYPDADPLEVARRWAAAGADLVVLTRGSHGVVGLSGPVCIDVAPPSVRVVDTVGAGDAFMAGLLHALWADEALGSWPGAIPEPELRHVLAVATSTAGVTLSRPGADPPWLNELPAGWLDGECDPA